MRCTTTLKTWTPWHAIKPNATIDLLYYLLTKYDQQFDFQYEINSKNLLAVITETLKVLA